MAALAKSTNDTPVEPETIPVLAQRWVRIASGLGLFGLCVVLTLAALRMPFVVIRTSSKLFTISGAAQTENLHLILAATGVIGAVLSVIYAATTANLRACFFVVGGVATGFSGLLMVGAWQTVQRGTIADPVIYAEVRQVASVMQIGMGLWASLVAGLGVLALAVVVLLAARASAPLTPPPPPKKRLF